MTNRTIVYFDGACPLCLREISLMRRLDWHNRIDFVDVSEPDAASACPIDMADLLERFHVTDSNGTLRSGADAFAAMWRATPLLAPFGHMARFPPVLWGLERLYRQFLRVRPRLQRFFAKGAPNAGA